MNGHEHFLEAERLIAGAQQLGPNAFAQHAPVLLAQAQVHATLALAAATALPEAEAAGWLKATGADRFPPTLRSDRPTSDSPKE